MDMIAEIEKEEENLQKNIFFVKLSLKIITSIFLCNLIYHQPQSIFLLYFIFSFNTIRKNLFEKSLEDNVQIEEEKKEIKIKSIVKYEDKYLDKYKILEITDLSVERLNELKNSILCENTPLGNVLMFYDNSRETFTYYSDNTIPYRFLESVSRKYVIFNNCKKLYVDMEIEIKEAEKKTEENKLKQDEINLLKIEREKNNKEGEKKNVFAKLKSYNKDTSLKSVSIPGDATKQSKPKKEEDKNKIVKENANRYSYEGKIANYQFIKKVDRKVVDKRYGMSFADFKKMQKN